MIKRLITFAALTVASLPGIFSQAPRHCDKPNTYLIDEDKPSVYLEFEQFGKAGDWKQARLGEESAQPKIEKGKDVWLRLYNNSCWELKIPTFSMYTSKIPDPANPGKMKIAFGQLPDATMANVFYKVEEQDRKQVVWGGDSHSNSWLPPGYSVLFPVYREHLENSRSIYVDFNFGWETKQFSNNLDPLHRSFFWGYRLEEAKAK